MSDDDYFTTDAGQFLVKAYCYLGSARILRDSAEARERPKLIQVPALHLLAHGIELLLKFPLLRAGKTEKQVGQEFGHRLMRLWDEPANSTLQIHVLQAASLAWEEAKESGEWPDPFTGDPRQVIVEDLAVLSHLHSQSSVYALRYAHKDDERAPQPRLLLDAFYDVADATLRVPSNLD